MRVYVYVSVLKQISTAKFILAVESGKLGDSLIFQASYVGHWPTGKAQSLHQMGNLDITNKLELPQLI